jgi:uncharacterized paraquat-inducible protein A
MARTRRDIQRWGRPLAPLARQPADRHAMVKCEECGQRKPSAYQLPSLGKHSVCKRCILRHHKRYLLTATSHAVWAGIKAVFKPWQFGSR